MIIRDIFREIYYLKIKKMSAMDFRLFHLRRIGMSIGNNCWIFSDDLETNESYLVSIGNDVMISAGVKLLTHDASASYYIPNASDLFGRVNIGNRVFIGMDTIVLPGVTIADNCIIGAGSVVTKSFFEEGTVIAGNPARKICTTEELRSKNERFALNCWNEPDKKAYILTHENKFYIDNR